MGLLSIDSVANQLNFFGWSESRFGYVKPIVRGSEDSPFKDFIYIGGSFSNDSWANWHLAFIKIRDARRSPDSGDDSNYTISILKFDSYECRMSSSTDSYEEPNE